MDRAISASDPVTDNLRVGMQLHMYQLGQFGGSNVQVDWASGDYRFNDRLGFRAGKIKTPLGLFNDSQDVDSLFLWILLPQAMYPVDNRGFDWRNLEGNCTAASTWANALEACNFRGMPATAPSIATGDTPSNWWTSDWSSRIHRAERQRAAICAGSLRVVGSCWASVCWVRLSMRLPPREAFACQPILGWRTTRNGKPENCIWRILENPNKSYF